MLKSVTTKMQLKDIGKVFVTSYVEFDQNGNEILNEEFNHDGSINFKYITAYDSQNRKVRLDIFTDADTPDETHKYFYNKAGKISNEEISVKGEKLIKTYFYYPNQLMTRTIDEDDAEKERHVIDYDANNNIVEEIVSDDFGEVNIHYKNEYDNNRLVRRYEYNSEGKEVRHISFSYDRNGLLVAEKIQGPHNWLFEYNTYKYDDQNREILRTFGKRGAQETIYDDVNHTVTKNTTTSVGQVMGSATITLDDQDRIIKEEDLETVRTIEYEEF